MQHEGQGERKRDGRFQSEPRPIATEAAPVRRWAVLAGGFAAALGLALDAAAQEGAQTPEGEARVLDAPLAPTEIITITAAKRAAPVSELPVSVQVLSGVLLDGAERFDGAETIIERLTGVQAAVANGNQIAFQIRGIGAVDHQALTPSGAAVHVDGVFLATNVQTGFLTYDLDRVEVLKGPQGVLYGRNASSGAINVLTRRPDADQTSYLAASLGEFGRVDLTGALGASLSDTLHARVAGRYLRQDSTLDNVQTNPDIPAGPDAAGGERDEFGLRVSLGWTPEAGGDWLFRAHYAEDNGVNPTPRNTSLDVGDFDISTEGDGVRDTDSAFYGASVEGAWRWGDWTGFSLTAFEGYAQSYGFDFDGTPAPFGDPTLNANLAYDRDYGQLSQEFRLDRALDKGHILIGLMAASETFQQDYLIWCGQLDPQTLLGTCRYVGAPGRVGPDPASDGVATTLLTQIDQDRVTVAPFFDASVDLTPRLSLNVGGRYTYEGIEGSGTGRHIFDDGTIALNNRDGVGPAQGENRIDENRLTGRAALSFALTDTTRAYASIGNGYKSGGFNGEVQNNATHFQDEGLFEAETVTAYEIGLKATPHPSLSVSAAAFFQDYQAPQARIFVNFPLPDGTSITSNSLANLDEATVYGLEADARWTPNARWDIAAGLTLLDTEIQQTSDAGGNAESFDGNPLPFASEVSATLAVRHERPLSADMTGFASAQAKYRSAFFLDAEGLEERSQDGYTTLDAEAGLGLDAKGMELSVWGRNLLDEDYAVSGFGFIGYNTFRSSPRTLGVAARMTF